MNEMTLSLAFLQGIGWTEILVILGVGLLIFGGRRIPELARSLGRSITEFKRGLSGIDDELKEKPKLPPDRPSKEE